jgi:hypothetical protein
VRASSIEGYLVALSVVIVLLFIWYKIHKESILLGVLLIAIPLFAVAPLHSAASLWIALVAYVTYEGGLHKWFDNLLIATKLALAISVGAYFVGSILLKIGSTSGGSECSTPLRSNC